MEIANKHTLDLEKLPPEDVTVIVGESGATFADSEV